MLVDKSGQPVASIVIPAYHSRDTIEECLEALMRQDTDLSYEIIVVETSGDGAGDIIRQNFPGVQLIEPGHRMYAGDARNLGAEKASGEILLFVDSDCITEQSWLWRMWRDHQEWECSAVAGSILNANPGTSVSIASYMNEHSDFYPTGNPRYVKYLCSGNVAYKMEVFKRHGGFPAGEHLYEDVMFNRMLNMAGEKLLFDPDIKIAHYHRTTMKEYLTHELNRGRGGAAARRRGVLIGASWVKYPILAFLAVPGLFLRKASVFPYRMLRAYPMDFFKLVRALPTFYLALLVWHYGFLSEVISPKSNSKSKDKVVGCTIN